MEMAEGYRVDLHALREAAAGVNGTISKAAKQRVSDIPHDESALGNHDLASTLGDFLGRWQRGVDNLAKDGQEIAVRLAASVKAYSDAEQAAHGDLNGILQKNGNDPGVK
ncbi:hypothetical protein ABTY61_04415 [Kitasatospora sp. NPDC096128]|uniref:hypothetical protein n=1 Tax=Kitasatospora sp. NPDC096128 TaxID=3155547 RepID=UPI003319D841